jgi:hypothetical protein
MPAAAVFVVSVDLDGGSSASSTDRRHLEAAAAAVQQALVGAGLAATWFAVNPSASRLVDRILAADTRAEIGLLGEVGWSAAGTSRQAFSSELSRRAAATKSAGYGLSALSLPAGPLDEHSDLMVKHGFVAVRGSGVEDARAGLSGMLRVLRMTEAVARPRAIRFGLWDVPATASLPGVPSAVAQRRIDLAARTGGVVHLTIDLGRIAVSGRGEVAAVEQTIARLAARAASEGLVAQTLSAAATGMGRGCKARPATSILRTKAA